MPDPADHPAPARSLPPVHPPFLHVPCVAHVSDGGHAQAVYTGVHLPEEQRAAQPEVRA